MTSWPPARHTDRRLDWSRFSSEGQELLKNLSSVIVLEWNRPVQYTQPLCACGCVCQRERKRGREQDCLFFFFLLVVLVNVSSCHSFCPVSHNTEGYAVIHTASGKTDQVQRFLSLLLWYSSNLLCLLISNSLLFPLFICFVFALLSSYYCFFSCFLDTLSWKIKVAPLIVVVKVTLSAFKPFDQSVVMSLNTVSLVWE